MQQTRGGKNTRVNSNKPRNRSYILVSRLIFLFRFLYSIIYRFVALHKLYTTTLKHPFQRNSILSSFCNTLYSKAP